jgi:hypothetical protein
MSIFADILGYGGIPLLGAGLAAAGVAAFIYVPVFGRYIAVGCAAASVGIFAYDAGFNERAAMDRSSEYAEQIALQKQDIAALQKAATDAQTIAADSAALQAKAEAQAASDQEKVNRYAAQLAKTPVAACSLSDADVRRLRSIGSSKRAATPIPPTRPVNLRPAGVDPAATQG